MTELMSDPIAQLKAWYVDAEQIERGADVIALATASADAKPSVRMVNFKGWYQDSRGECLSFFSNYESAKGRDLAANPAASMLFYWPMQRRQVQVSGICCRLSRTESERYFATRDREAQLSTWMSQQSRELDAFESMERCITRLQAQFAGQTIPCPPYWGGTLLFPDCIEFRLSREHRRHYRWQYRRVDSDWQQRKLFP